MAIRISLDDFPAFVFDRGELRGDGIHELRDPESVLRRDLEEIGKPETMELHSLGEAPLAIDLVHREEDSLAQRPELRCQVTLLGKKARAAVDDPANEIGVSDRDLDLRRDLFVQWSRDGFQNSPGVNHLERLSSPFDRGLVAIARRTGDGIDDRSSRAAHAVEERGLAHVGPPDDGDLGQALLHKSSVYRDLRRHPTPGPMCANNPNV